MDETKQQREIDDDLPARGLVELWQAIGLLKADINSVNVRLNEKEPAQSAVARFLGQKISLSSIIALVSACVALFLSIQSYRQSLPQNNIRNLGFHLEPYPTHFWYSRYWLKLPVSGSLDLNPQIKNEKSRIFNEIEKLSFKNIYMPCVQLVNEGSKLYSITRIKVETGAAWQIVQLNSKPHIFREFLNESKYSNIGIVPSGEGAFGKSVILEPGKPVHLFPDILIMQRHQNADDEAWLKLTLYSSDKELVMFRQNGISAFSSELGFLLNWAPEGSELYDVLRDAFLAAGYEHLARKVSEKAKNF